ncbi:MAG: phosphotransferase [Anaerolineales bacterium]
MSVINEPQQITIEWLTAVLYRRGLLPVGEIEHIHFRPNEAFNSTVLHLEVVYSSDTPSTAPRAILVKLNRHHNGELEDHFYQHIQGLPNHQLPVVNCYEAAYDPDTGFSHCLLEDVSATHRPPISRHQLIGLQGIPSSPHMESIVDALAQFHAYWWESPQLGSSEGIFAVRPWYRDQAYFQQHFARRKNEWTQFSAQVGTELPTELTALYEQVLSHFPHLWARYLGPRITDLQAITVTHGDCYLTQFLCPKEGIQGQTYLVDFDSASANFGAYDLAYLIPTFWTREQRTQNTREQNLLRRYHQGLLAHGVVGYPWETLLDDYRLMISMMIFDPVWDQTNGSSKAYWQPKMQCLTDAYIDLNCAALLAD